MGRAARATRMSKTSERKAVSAQTLRGGKARRRWRQAEKERAKAAGRRSRPASGTSKIMAAVIPQKLQDPSSKLQGSSKHQPRRKLQDPSTNIQGNFKLQAPNVL